jgi:crossover junction endodeoxyribonuclease RuvC
MLQHTLNIKEDVRFFDATDAVAVALCHHYQQNSIVAASKPVKKTTSKKVSSWEAFVASNPGRVKTV